MTIVGLAIFGLVTGMVAHFIDPSVVKGGLIGSMVLGIIGAIIGGTLANVFFGFGVTGVSMTSFIIAVGAALLVVFVQHAISRPVE